MKPSLVSAALALGGVCIALTGCQPEHQATVRKAKPDDPTAWSGPTITRDSDDSGASGGFFKQGSRLSGAMSSEGADVEKSLGFGR